MISMYILMRSDMNSLNPGKAIAQGTHAANQCVFDLRSYIAAAKCGTDRYNSVSDLKAMLSVWEENRGFGVCIVLDVGTHAELRKAIFVAQQHNLFADVTHDPSYPVRDGQVTHLIPVDTCGYVFGRKDKCGHVLSGYNLYP
jgi:peptidyl-tRNA hydrolase